MNVMTIQFEPTSKDARTAARQLSSVVRYYLVILWGLVAVWDAYMIHKSMQEGYSFAESFRYDGSVTLIVLGAFFALLLWFLPFLTARRTPLRPQEWNLNEERVQIQTPVASVELHWDAYLKYRETPKLFLLYPQRNIAHFIPKRSLSAQQIDELRNLIASHTSKKLRTESREPMPTVTPFLWFDKEAEDAANFYLSVFHGAKKISELRSNGVGPWPEGAIAIITIELMGQQMTFLNGGPTYKLSHEAFSFFIACDTQEEIDYYWDALQQGGGAKIQCGWLKDKYGLSWQVAPKDIGELISHPNAMKAMMGMKKLDIAALQAAAR